MKKLLALVLVFAMASLANAGLITYSLSATDIELGSADVVTVTVVASGFDADGLGDIALVDTLVTAVTGDTSSFVISNLAADSVWDFALGTNVTLADTDLQVSPPGGASSASVTLFTFDVSLSGTESDLDAITFSADCVTAMLASDFMSFTNNITSADGTITVVPEPMTIALLGLGGLFLRRRRS